MTDNPYDSPKSGLEASSEVKPLETEGDGTGGVIPYKNPAALSAYYLGIVGLIPVLGVFAAIPALVLGVIGLRKYKQNPIIKGTVHAWIGIVLGTIGLLGNLACCGILVGSAFVAA